LLFLILIPVMMICRSFSNQMLVLSSTCLANCPRCATNITRDINAPGEGGIGVITHSTWWNTGGAEKYTSGSIWSYSSSTHCKEMTLLLSLLFFSWLLLNAMIMQCDLLFLHNIVFKPDFTEKAFSSVYVWYVDCSPYSRAADK
jgi:hypothetical protein